MVTEAELLDHEKHASSVDSRMSERVLALVAEVRRLREQELRDADAIERLSVQNESLLAAAPSAALGVEGER